MSPASKELLRITGQAFAALLLTLLADAFVIAFAFMFMMGDHTSTVPRYDYSRETRTVIFILSSYSILALGIGFYWQHTRKLTARFVGIIVGVAPIIILIAFRFLSHFKFGN